MTAPVPCGKCHRPLKDEASKRRGLGPVCWRHIHGAPPAPRGLASHHHVPAAEQHPVDPNQLPLPLEDPVDAETRKAAVDTVARYALHRHTDYAVSVADIAWEDYPDLAGADWDAVLARIQAITKSMRPSDEGFDAAYKHLAQQETTVQEGQN